MNLTANGKIPVPTPGTPVALAVTAASRSCHLATQVCPANTGKVYLGTPGMVKATLAGVLHVFQIPEAGQPYETYEVEPHEDTDPLYLFEYAVDADVATEGLIVSWWVQ
jgi:hypothetical protein